MTKRNEILLLQIIEASGNFKRLTREGLTFKEITNLLIKLEEKEQITYHKGKIALTSIGKEELKTQISLIKNPNKEQWISPENKSRIKKYERNFIFLPLNSELDF